MIEGNHNAKIEVFNGRNSSLSGRLWLLVNVLT